MNILGYHHIQIEHYNGATIEAYRMAFDRNYRLRLVHKGGFWSWAFDKKKDGDIYLSKQHALMACSNYIFINLLHLSMNIEKRKWHQAKYAYYEIGFEKAERQAEETAADLIRIIFKIKHIIDHDKNSMAAATQNSKRGQ